MARALHKFDAVWRLGARATRGLAVRGRRGRRPSIKRQCGITFVKCPKHWISATLLLALVSVGAETLTVNVSTDGPREGTIDILVFNSKKGFPNKPEKAFLRARFPVMAENPVECVITNLPYGTYSLSLLHDINDNYKADKMLGLGPPKEPVGFSNIDEKMRKKPSYKSTLITFNAQTNVIAASVWYVL